MKDRLNFQGIHLNARLNVNYGIQLASMDKCFQLQTCKIPCKANMTKISHLYQYFWRNEKILMLCFYIVTFPS
jgi:hypothetical protein